jgi:chromate transporter
MMFLFRLFVEFFQIGLFAVGGGLATLPFLYRLADKSGWLGRAQIADMIAVSESTPGAIGVNLATYTGFVHSGIPGAIIATLGLVTPSVIVVIIIARVLESFKQSTAVRSIFSGFRPASTGLIAAACFSILALSLYNGSAEVWYAALRLPETILFLVIFVALRKFKKHPLYYIAAAGAAGMVMGL